MKHERREARSSPSRRLITDPEGWKPSQQQDEAENRIQVTDPTAMELGGNDRNDGGRDIERAVAALAERLPQPLWPLARLAFNYRWAWMPGAAALFREIDPAAWRHGEGNPVSVIQAVLPRRLNELAATASFVARAEAFAAALDGDLRRPCWRTPIPPSHPVAYICSEFAIHCSLPLYSGGLGVLAGDLLKAASDMGVPMVGVGLLYREGYFRQRLDAFGWQHEYWVNTACDRLPAVRVTAANGDPMTVTVVIRSRAVRIQIWRIDVGRVPLYLLDTDRDDNHPIDRWITARLYIGDRHTRLAQYAVLGIGSVRALDALGIRPSLFHLNEGHGVLSSRERLRQLLTAGQPLEQALAVLRQHTVFTTHTPVAVGNEAYTAEEVEPVLGDFIDDVGLPRRTYYGLGRIAPWDEREPTNFTVLAIRTSGATNGVSRRHGEVARAMWHRLWSDRPESEVPIQHVTNGVHTSTWMSAPMQELLDRFLGPEWRLHLNDPEFWERIHSIPASELWRARCTLREAFVRYVREQSIRDRLRRGEPPAYVDAAARTFDPDVLTIGFARRLATYKRFYLLTRYPERALGLLNSKTPIQLVVAGKAHPQDQDAKDALHAFLQLRQVPEIAARVVFLEDYDLHKAPDIMAGVDVWLNLPRPPMEASGTSGMKVALNGGLNVSVLDGWWLEAYDGQNGWAITSPQADSQSQDNSDAAAAFDIMQREVVPLFYERDDNGVPQRWMERIKAAMRAFIPRFSAERMLRDYVEKMYRTRADGEAR